MLTLNSTRNGKPVIVDGQNLSIAAVTAASRYHASVSLDESPALKAKITKSRKVMADKVDAGLSVYGVSTGFGGSADTRTNQPILLGNALLQHQQSGVLPSSMKPLDVLPLQDPLSATSMPESWVRGAILIRMNSLIRGHSGVRWELIEKMNQLLHANITPLVPLRGTISASGGNNIHLNFILLYSPLNGFSKTSPRYPILQELSLATPLFGCSTAPLPLAAAKLFLHVRHSMRMTSHPSLLLPKNILAFSMALLSQLQLQRWP